MSIKIKDGAKPSSVSDTEYKILQDQDNLPNGWPVRPELSELAEARPLNERANTGTVNTANLTIEELEAELERRKEAETQPKIEDKGGIVDEDGDEEAEDYDEGWNNEQRAAELAERDLNVTGNKAEMIARLLRSDNDELTEDDAPASE